MNEKECIEHFGLMPAERDIPLIREILAEEIRKEAGSQGKGDTDLIRLCCVQLFSAGNPDDVLLILRAKKSSMDADFVVDVQFLCGAGLFTTKQYLQTLGTKNEASTVLDYITKCEAKGDFEDFSVTEHLNFYLSYYADE